MVSQGLSLAYFDTNIYGALVARPESWEPVRAFLDQGDLLLGVSDANVLELSSAPGLLRDLARFLLRIPSAWLKPTLRIFEDEVRAYLDGTDVNPVVGPIAPLILEVEDPVGYLERFLQREVITSLRAKMVHQKPAFEKRIRDTFGNFRPIVEPERHTEADGPFYAFQLIWEQVLDVDWPECAARIRREMKITGETRPVLPPQFRGLWLFALAQFYRYYLHRREPSGNDYGDFLQVVPIPYCRIAIVERRLSEDLMHIKSNDPVLQYTTIHNLEFLRHLTALPFV